MWNTCDVLSLRALGWATASPAERSAGANPQQQGAAAAGGNPRGGQQPYGVPRQSVHQRRMRTFKRRYHGVFFAHHWMLLAKNFS